MICEPMANNNTTKSFSHFSHFRYSTVQTLEENKNCQSSLIILFTSISL